MVGFSTKKKEDIQSYSRDNRDNKVFKSIQIKDISTVTDENTIYVWDFDKYPFACASLVEDDYILATNVADGSILESANVTSFWGAGNSVGVNSYIGIENIRREIEGLSLFDKNSFTIEHKKRLQTKYINKDTGKKFINYKRDGDGKPIPDSGDPLHLKLKVNKDINDVVDILKIRIREVARQWNIQEDKFLFCLGEGSNFRCDLDLPQPYKGQRNSGLRPLLLKEARQWVRDNLNHEDAPENYECDDQVEHYAAKSARDYHKTGVHSYCILSTDKDSYANEKLFINPDRADGDFKFPQAVLVEGASKSVGHLELVQKSTTTEVKGSGLLWCVAQSFGIGDSADFYHPYAKFDKEIKKNIKYGQVAFYKDFVNLKTPKDVLQKAMNNLYLWFPRGIKYYVPHKDITVDVDTITWACTIFKTAYMTKRIDDPTTLLTLLDYFKVDYSALVGNNKERVYPFKEEPLLREVVNSLRSEVRDLAELATPKKAEAKPLQIAKLENVVERLNKLEKQFNNLFAIEDK